MTHSSAPHTLLAQKSRELDLVMTLDHIRDSATDPAAMLAMIVNAMADRFNADLCLLSVVDRESGQLELKSVSHRGKHLRQLEGDEIRRLAEHAFEARQINVWEPDHLRRELNFENMPADLHMAAIPIM